MAFCLLSVWAGLIKYGGPMYTSWAESQNQKIRGILNAARVDHTLAVKNRIEAVKQMGGVVEITKSLFEVSKVWERRDWLLTGTGVLWWQRDGAERD